MAQVSITSKDGRYTLLDEQEFAYLDDWYDFPSGNQQTYLIDNILGTKTELYSYGGSGIYIQTPFFSRDEKFAIFQFRNNDWEEYTAPSTGVKIVNIKTGEVQTIASSIAKETTVGLSGDGSKVLWNVYTQRGLAEDAYYFPNIPQLALPEAKGAKIDLNGFGTIAVGDTAIIQLGLKEITTAVGVESMTLSLSTGVIAKYDDESSRPGEFLAFKYTVSVDEWSPNLSITSVNLNGAKLSGFDGTPAVISADLARIKGTLIVDGYQGTNGDENFRGTTGAEVFRGLGGNDTYRINNIKDRVYENKSEGSDTIVATVSYSLQNDVSVENIRVASSARGADINLSGNDFSQTLEGGSGNNTLDGRRGADTMIGYAGNDTYYVENPGDIVLEAKGGGVDRVLTTISYTLGAGQEIEHLAALSSTSLAALRLVGNSFAQTITGNAGDNELVGKGGGDKLIGRGGDDTYYVRDSSDRVFESTGGGFDTVRTARSYALAAGQAVEVLGFTDEGGTDDLSLTGNAFGQTRRGNPGDNRLDGGGGADTLIGRGDNDIYIVDNAGDVALEGRGAGQDTVLAAVSHALKAGQAIEALEALSATGKAALNLTGNEFAQGLKGNAGANILDGGRGADVMAGLAGNDTYLFDDVRDVVIEGRGQGTDTVVTTVSTTLAAGQEIEILRLAATVGERSLDLNGNAFGQKIIGSAGANVIDGRGGTDILLGGSGRDTFMFSTKLDARVVAHITDFSPINDTVALVQGIFSGLDAGPLATRAFKNLDKAVVDADDRVLYKQSTGELFYDADGSGGSAAVKFAVLDNHAKLTHDDFFVV